MRWWLPLAAILAFSIANAWIDRNPVPLRPLEQQIANHQTQRDKNAQKPSGDHQIAKPPIPDRSDFRVPKGAISTATNARQKPEGEPKWTDKVQAASAGMVAALTVVLIVINIFQTCHISRSTEAAMRAAKAAERALDEHERPWVFRDIVTVNWRNTRGIDFNDYWVSLKWKNVGRSPAIIRSFEYKFGDENELKLKPDYTNSHQFGTVPTLAPDGDFNTQRVGPAGVPNNGIPPIQYIFFGRLTYTEMNGKEHKSGFALMLAPMGCLALEWGGDLYNYYT